MTREEKIAELINIRDNFNYTLAPREVFDDAIKALEQEPCGDAISRQAVLDVWHTSYSDNREENEEIQYKKIAFELPSVNPQEPVFYPQEKPIVAKTITSTDNTSGKVFNKTGDYVYPSDIVLETPNTATSMPCENTISRQAVLESIFDDDTEYTGSEICSMVHNLPSVNSQEPTIEAYKQVCKERDIAIEQLHELGYEWGQKIEPCDDAISRQAAMRVLDEIGSDFDSPRNAVVSLDEIADAIQDLPSVNSQPICEEREKGECPYYAG